MLATSLSFQFFFGKIEIKVFDFEIRKSTMGRLQYLEVDNFKSYMGKQIVGPFHNFTCIIGKCSGIWYGNREIVELFYRF